LIEQAEEELVEVRVVHLAAPGTLHVPQRRAGTVGPDAIGWGHFSSAERQQRDLTVAGDDVIDRLPSAELSPEPRSGVATEH
jgi:hypothetical protein